MEYCDRVEHLCPTTCPGCGTKLGGSDPSPKRHQVTEIPRVKPVLVEHQIHTLACPGCGCRSAGLLPTTVPGGCFGPNVVAVVKLLSDFVRLSQRIIASLLRELFDLEISDG